MGNILLLEMALQDKAPEVGNLSQEGPGALLMKNEQYSLIRNGPPGQGPTQAPLGSPKLS